MIYSDTKCVANTLPIILDYINLTLSFFLMRSMTRFLLAVVHSLHTLRHYTTGSELTKSGCKQKSAIQSLQQVDVLIVSEYSCPNCVLYCNHMAQKSTMLKLCLYNLDQCSCGDYGHTCSCDSQQLGSIRALHL